MSDDTGVGVNLVGRLIRWTAVLGLGLACAGCVTFGGVDRDAATIDKSVGVARNSSILLNIVRASRNEPLYFYSINQVQGSGIEDFKLSLPPVTFGPHQSAAQQNYTFGTNGLNVLDSQHSGYFNVAVLDSKNFYTGMLAPLELAEVNILIKQGFARELVYRLVVDDITFYGPHPLTKKVGLYRFDNNPASDNYPLFNIFLTAAMSHGITTEEYGLTRAAGGAATEGKDSASTQSVAARLCADMTLVEDPKASADVDQSHNACGERPVVLPAQVSGPAQVEGLRQAYAACTTAKSSTDSSATRPTNRVCAVLDGQVYAVQLDTRSLFGIFRYLGAAMAGGRAVDLQGLGAASEQKASGPLINVVKDRRPDCFASADWRGHYCIPGETRSDNLKQVFSVINALQALKTSPGDLPFTPTVRVEQ